MSKDKAKITRINLGKMLEDKNPLLREVDGDAGDLASIFGIIPERLSELEKLGEHLDKECTEERGLNIALFLLRASAQMKHINEMVLFSYMAGKVHGRQEVIDTLGPSKSTHVIEGFKITPNGVESIDTSVDNLNVNTKDGLKKLLELLRRMSGNKD